MNHEPRLWMACERLRETAIRERCKRNFVMLLSVYHSTITRLSLACRWPPRASDCEKLFINQSPRHRVHEQI